MAADAISAAVHPPDRAAMTDAFSAVLLAGGHSRRMGRDKALLDAGGRTLLEHQLATLQRLNPAEVLLSCRCDQDYPACGVRIVRDKHVDCGPLGAIASCLEECQTNRLIVLAVDMPAMTAAYLRELLGFGPASVIPEQAGGRLEPLSAVYSRALLPSARECLARRDFALRPWIRSALALGSALACPVPSDQAPLFTNWNTANSTFGTKMAQS